jgi:hypothetical protein
VGGSGGEVFKAMDVPRSWKLSEEALLMIKRENQKGESKERFKKGAPF